MDSILIGRREIVIVVRIRGFCVDRLMTVSEKTTLRAAFEGAGIDTILGKPFLNGVFIPESDLNKTFSQYDIKERCFLQDLVIEHLDLNGYIVPVD